MNLYIPALFQSFKLLTGQLNVTHLLLSGQFFAFILKHLTGRANQVGEDPLVL